MLQALCRRSINEPFGAWLNEGAGVRVRALVGEGLQRVGGAVRGRGFGSGGALAHEVTVAELCRHGPSQCLNSAGV